MSDHLTDLVSSDASRYHDLASLLQRPAWHADAACRGMGTDHFLLERGHHPDQLTAARAICARCAVQEPCLAAALTHNDTQGIWAGTTAHDRRRTRQGAA